MPNPQIALVGGGVWVNAAEFTSAQRVWVPRPQLNRCHALKQVGQVGIAPS